MADGGTFEIHGTYDEGEEAFLDADGNVSFELNDEHGIAGVESFSLSVSDGRLLKVWKAMRYAADLADEVEESLVSVRMHMDGIDCQPEHGMNPRYGMVAAYPERAKFEATDKHSSVTVETREIDLVEIEEHLISAGLITESDRRSEPPAAAPGPR